MNKRIIIIGGGISGLSLAWKLAQQGFEIFVIESENIVGGLSATMRENGYCMDIGPHSFFTENDKIKNTVLGLFNPALKPEPRQVKFYYNGKYLDYPLTAYGVLFGMGFISGMKAGFSFIASKLLSLIRRKNINEKEMTVEDWAINSFGNYLYKSFFKPYTEQFWKMSCKELSARSIPSHTRTSFINTLRLLLQKRRAKKGSSLVEREMLPTYYPETGYGEISEKVAEMVFKAGGEIYTNSKAVSLQKLANGSMRVSYLENGNKKTLEGNHVISTIPIPNFINMLKPEVPEEISKSAQKLKYRSIVSLGMVTEKQNILDCGYMYLLNRPYNRISEMNKFSPKTSPDNENIIMIEIPCLSDSTAWESTAEELYEMCVGSLAEDGIIGPGDVKHLLMIKRKYAYPIYTKDYYNNLQKILNYINETEGIYTLGRVGEFMYMDLDKCMKRSFDFSEKFIQSKQFS